MPSALTITQAGVTAGKRTLPKHSCAYALQGRRRSIAGKRRTHYNNMAHQLKRFKNSLLFQRPTVCVTRVWAGVDNVWEQEKLEARKMLENAAESHTSGARCVGRLSAKVLIVRDRWTNFQ